LTLEPAGPAAAAAKTVDLGGPQRPGTLSKDAIQALDSIQMKIKKITGAKQSALEAPAAHQR